MHRGFTLIELIVGIAVGLLLLTGLLTLFTIARTTLQKGQEVAELTQNGRIVLERLSRELRQAEVFVTVIPETAENAAHTVEFQDGHNAAGLNYVRYYLENNILKRELAFYYFTSDPLTHVLFNTVDENGNPAQKTVTENEPIAEYISDFSIWGNRLINIALTASKNAKSIQFNTTIYARNSH